MMSPPPRHIHVLLGVALATDILAPILIMYGIAPPQTRWLSHIAIAAMLPVAYLRIVLVNGVPKAVLFALAASIIGVAVAMSHGQGLLPSAWGWWIIFQFPIVGLFAYLQPRWPDHFAEKFSKFCIAFLAVTVLVQVGQYLAGQAPGDHLAGLFGVKGTGNLVIFAAFVCCIGLGRWLTDGEWRSIIITFLLGSVASALGEMKLFVPAIAALSMLAAVIFAVRHGRLLKLVPFALVIVTFTVISVEVYDKVIKPEESKSLAAFLLNDETRDRYLGGVRKNREGEYRVGRNEALGYAFDEIRETKYTLLFGYGLGARRGSTSLGMEGSALAKDNVTFSGGTSLLLLVQELGLFGMLLVAVCNVWIIVELFRGIQRYPFSENTHLRYALLLFTCLLPLWMWYNRFLTLRVPMLLYAMALGYLFSEFSRESTPSTTAPQRGQHRATRAEHRPRPQQTSPHLKHAI